VLAGRSMREVEKREARLVLEVALAWVVTLFATFVVIAFVTLLGVTLKARPLAKRRHV